MKCRQQLSVRSSVGALEAPSGYALRCLQCIKANRTVYVLQNRTFLFATNSPVFSNTQFLTFGNTGSEGVPARLPRYGIPW